MPARRRTERLSDQKKCSGEPLGAVYWFRLRGRRLLPLRVGAHSGRKFHHEKRKKMSAQPDAVAAILNDLSADEVDDPALTRLLPHVYAELRQMAGRCLAGE